MSHIVLAKAWNNGKFLPNGGGYGIRLTNYFKDEYLDINWVSITLELEGWEKQVELAINTDAFWSHGRELRSGVIGKWLILEQLKPHRLDKISFFPKNFFFHFALLTFPHFPVGIVEILLP